MPDLDDTLKDRGSSYGPFKYHADISQKIKGVLETAYLMNPRFQALDSIQQNVILEGNAMIAHKLARLANGDPLHEDGYRDIMGYAKITYEHATGEKL